MAVEVLAEPEDKMLSVSQLANYGLNRTTAYKLMGDGRLPFRQFCPEGKRYIRRSDVLALIANCAKPAQEVSGV